jgi:hypothetical protein
MSRPFIIWTVPRTAGTALLHALGKASGMPVLNEPFQYGAVPGPWSEIYNLWKNKRRSLGVLGPHGIKHIPESFDDEFNIALIEATKHYGYRHIRLYRRDWLAMLVSRDVANQLNAWTAQDAIKAHADVLAGKHKLKPLDVPRLISDLRLGWWRWEAVKPHLPDFLEVTTEDISCEGVYQLAKHLDVSADKIDFTNDTDQHTRDLYRFIPNMDELRSALKGEG